MKLIRITTIPMSLDLLLTGQMSYLKNNGLEVIMVSSKGEGVIRVVEREGCPHIIVPFTRQISLFQDLKCLFLLIKIIRREKPAIVHTHTPKAGLIGMLASKICGVPLRLHTIAGLPIMTAKGIKKKLLLVTEKLTAWGAHKVLPNSKSLYEYMIRNRMVDSNKLDIIGNGSSNGINLKRFSKLNIEENILDRIKETINYDSNLTYIIAVGRIVKDKGISELVEAFLQIIKEYQKVRLVVVGSIEEIRKEEILPKKIIKELNENSDIYHVNWSNEVEYYLHLADLIIHASHREGFPNVLLQAAAMDCPIICSDIPGNIDIVTDGITGLYFEKGNIFDLTQKVIYALENPKIMRENTKLLKKEIEEKFSREVLHYSLLQYYQKEINARS